MIMRLEKPTDDELERLLNEIPHATSALNRHQLHPLFPIHAQHQNYHHHAFPSSSSSTSLQTPLTAAASDRRLRRQPLDLDLDLVGYLQNLSLHSDPNLNLNPNPTLNLNPNPTSDTDPCPFVLRRNPTIPTFSTSEGTSFMSEESFILDGRNLYSNNSGRDASLNENYVARMARDQDGCRLLQKKLDEGRREDVDLVFNGVIRCVGDLMMNPFANYLVQKLLDVCTEEQRMGVVFKLTRDPSEIIRVSLNTHGTRVVQKLIETLKAHQQIRLVVSALKPGFLNLIKDLNGNHVIQCCLKSFSTEHNKFIFDAAAKHCVEIATHQHGCCVLQRCITHSTGEFQAHMVQEIIANGLLLAQDAFGNYVVQFILDLKNPSAMASLASQFEGNYVDLSTQKFSSNVVQKCLGLFTNNHQARIVRELLRVTRFEMLLQDPYANYVIQTALSHTKGPVQAALVSAIQPHAAVLRTSPYCRRIFSLVQAHLARGSSLTYD